jgi:hypothetical protein
MLSNYIVDIPSNEQMMEFQKKRDSLGIWHSFLESTITKKGNKHHNKKRIEHLNAEEDIQIYFGFSILLKMCMVLNINVGIFSRHS